MFITTNGIFNAKPPSFGGNRPATPLKAGGLLYSKGALTGASSDVQVPAERGTPPHFAGRYTLRPEARLPMKHGLRGWPEVSGVIGPDYFPAPHCEAALLDYMEKDAEVPREVVQELALGKARVSNTYSLILGLPMVFPENLFVETRMFIRQMKEQIADADRVFKEQYHFSDEELHLYHRFIAKTAPLLFNMGFPDAIPHAGQVSRLAVFKAYEELVSNGIKPVDTTLLLQTAMVGWLHDPKFPTGFSEDNMGSHPLIASAIADMVFHDESFAKALKAHLNSKSPRSSLDYRQFSTGAMEALSINNDSRYVLQNVIIPRVADQIEEIYGKEVAEKFGDLARARLEAPSHGKKPQPFPDDIMAALQSVTLKTGITGINRDAWKKTCEEAGIKTGADELLTKILDGDAEVEPLLMRMSGLLRKQKNAVFECTVDGRNLFSHHDEVAPSGKTASLALINSDPLMLSPHKIIAVADKETIIESLSAFMASFQSNINDLPLRSQEKARQWQRAVYIAILRSAEKLTGRVLLGPENDSPHFKTFGDDLQDQVNFLCQIILMEETWGDFAGVTKKNPGFQTALEMVEKEYLHMAKEFRNAVFEEDGLKPKEPAR